MCNGVVDRGKGTASVVCVRPSVSTPSFEPTVGERLQISAEMCVLHECLQCFDAVGWEAGRASGL